VQNGEVFEHWLFQSITVRTQDFNDKWISSGKHYYVLYFFFWEKYFMYLVGTRLREPFQLQIFKIKTCLLWPY